jgi:hypothetical protein
MKTEKRNLIETLMDEEEVARRETTLLGGGRILRRRRWRRTAWRSFAGIAILALAVLSIQKMTGPRSQALTAIALPQERTGGLTDAELLAMFPKTPVGLITLENGKKRLIFPRPGDEERFMGRY